MVKCKHRGTRRSTLWLPVYGTAPAEGLLRLTAHPQGEVSLALVSGQGGGEQVGMVDRWGTLLLLGDAEATRRVRRMLERLEGSDGKNLREYAESWGHRDFFCSWPVSGLSYS
jgi:hypothetical protein